MNWYLFFDILAWVFGLLFAAGFILVLMLQDVKMRSWGFIAGIVSIAYLAARYMS